MATTAESPSLPAGATAEPVSWKIVSYIYIAGCALCALFAVLDRVVEVEAVKGFWVIFSLFPFCLVYSFHRHRLQVRERQAEKPKIE